MPPKLFNIAVSVCFLCSVAAPIPGDCAPDSLGLPEPGAMISVSPSYEPVLIKGLKIHPENPFLFDFILDAGSTGLQAKDSLLKKESGKVIKYFLAAMTIPEKDLWVNLSPYEKNRMITPNLAQTQMGRDMLAQDYILKQLTASLIYPEKDLGKKFWDEVYAKARELYHTTQIPVNTFNKVWIVADRADVFERGQVVYVVGAHLKVMLDEDYVALAHHVQESNAPGTHTLTSQIVRQLVLPSLEKEINTGKNFAPLRQMFYSMILASWYKMTLKHALLTQVYGNKSKVSIGINQPDTRVNEEIFNRYLRAYKKGVFNYIKEDLDQASQQTVPRKYFSGGLRILPDPAHLIRKVDHLDEAMLHVNSEFIARVGVSPVNGSASNGGTDETLPKELLAYRDVYRIKGEKGKTLQGAFIFNAGTYSRLEQKMEVLRYILQNPLAIALPLRLIDKDVSTDRRITLTRQLGAFFSPSLLGKTFTLKLGNISTFFQQTNQEKLPELIKILAAKKGNNGKRKNKNRMVVYFLMTIQLYGETLVILQVDEKEGTIKPFGGGFQFNGPEGRQRFFNLFPKVRTIENEDPMDFRLKNISRKNVGPVVRWFKRGSGVETPQQAAQREALEEGFVGPNGLLKKWPSLSVPIYRAVEVQKKQALADAAMPPGGIDLDSNKMSMTVHKHGQGVRIDLDAAMMARMTRQGFEGFEFNIESIVPAVNLPAFLGLI